MSGLLDDLQEMEPAVGQNTAVAMGETKRRADAGKNGTDGDFSMMDHFVRGLIERPDDT